MGFYTGSSADGSDMRPIEGMYTDPNDSNLWSNQPYNREQKKYSRCYRNIVDEVNGKRSFMDEYLRVLEKKSNLNKESRDWLVEQLKQ